MAGEYCTFLDGVWGPALAKIIWCILATTGHFRVGELLNAFSKN